MAAPLPQAMPLPDPRGSSAPAPALERLLPLDIMRGLVMVLMAVDHSSEAFNAGRLFTDSVFLYQPGTPLPVAQFLTRWVTHLCAPTFLFLAGTGLAFTVQKEIARKKPPLAIDRYLLVRGLLIWAFELWISAFIAPPGRTIFQVLYAIGTSYLLMIPLRRLSPRSTAALGILLVVFGEALVGLASSRDPADTPLALMLLLTGGRRPNLIIGYPSVHWLALMLLGWAWGHHLLARALSRAPKASGPTERAPKASGPTERAPMASGSTERTPKASGPTNPEGFGDLARSLALVGLWLLAGFVVIRGANHYGNMMLLRQSNAVVDWLHVSKYPPSASYDALELGVMSLCLAGLFALPRRHVPSANHPLVVLGQTPMFFYLLHFPLLVGSAHLLGVAHQLGLGATFLGAAVVVLLLYPACRLYRSYKLTHKDSWTRYI